MKHTIYGLICILAALVLLFVIPYHALAESFPDDPEEGYGGPVTGNGNLLQEDYWERDGELLYYTEEGYESSVGVDVSKWNGDIDWYSLAEQGVEFAIIRVGYRGYETGDMVLDERFYEYADGAAAAGLDIGVYFYSQAIDVDEAVEEALFVIDIIGDCPVSLPVYFDTEEVRLGESRTDIMATANYTMNAEAFCETIEEYGYRAGVYASHEWIRKNLDLPRLSGYDIWYAMHGSTPGREYGFDMWQYSSTGDLYGCDTYLDMNVRVARTY